MARTLLTLFLAFALGVIAGRIGFPSTVLVKAQSPRRVIAMRLYTGPDHQTHAEEVALDFTDPGAMSKLRPITAGELHAASAGSVNDWHHVPRRQYVITISGHGEVEVAGGKKVADGPGHIALVEDTTGKGHITRVVGNEDRITLQFPLADQSGR
jgi:hypothetical protein